MVQGWRELPALLMSDYWAAAHEHADELYRPLVMVSYLVNYLTGGADPFGYHVVNVALHVLVGYAVYHLGLLLRLSWHAALVAALFFAVHPIHTEAVDPITGRADLLCTLGVLLALRWYIDLDRATGSRPGLALASWAAFFVALSSKETGIVLPGLLVLYEVYAWERRGSWRAWFDKKKFLLLGYAICGAAYIIMRWLVLGDMYRAGLRISFADNPMAALLWDVRALNALLVSGRYLWLFIWPAELSADYSYNAIPLAREFWDSRMLGPLLAWTALGGLAAWSYLRGSRFCFFAVGYLYITFLPVSNLLAPIGTIMGERLFYMPSVGLCLLLGRAFQWSFYEARPAFPRTMKTISCTVVLAALVGLTWRTVVRNRDWRSSTALWAAAARVVPESAKVHYVHGVQALDAGRFGKAVERFERALEIYPGYAKENLGLARAYGAALIEVNRMAEAIPHLEYTVARTQRWADVYSNLGVAYLAQESWIKAEGAFRKAIALDINMLEAQKGLMLALRKQGRNLEALAAADQALARNSDFLGARVHRAGALEALGRSDEAREEMAVIRRTQIREEVPRK